MRSVSHEDYLVMSASSHAADVDDQGNVTTTPPRPKSKSESHKK
jgi:hypothetical protein